MNWTQTQLADKCGVSSSRIGHIEAGTRGVDRGLRERLAQVFGVEPTALEGLLLEDDNLRATGTEVISRIERLLADSLKRLGASSAIFYTADPFWPDELRLVAMAGVKFPEPMHGFVSAEGTRRVLLHGDCEYCENTHDSNDRRDTLVKLPSTIPKDRWNLFSDFVEREGVGASARLFIKSGATAEAILFVNYSHPAPLCDARRPQLYELRDALRDEIPALRRVLPQIDAPVQHDTIRLLRPMQDWVARIGHQQQTIKQYLESVLADVMTVVGMDTREGFGTIHLYRPESDDLKLAAFRGSISWPEIQKAEVQSVARGEGIISWVALRQRAIVIDDIERSAYRAIYLPLRTGIRSEVAVPMLAGREFIGVLNLESELPGKFAGHQVRALWYAAGSAAVASQLFRHTTESQRLSELNSQLLEMVCSAAMRKTTGPELESASQGYKGGERSALDDLAEFARAYFSAMRCDIWCYDPAQVRPFGPAGASYEIDTKSQPRPNGWSEYVCRSLCPVWVGNIRSRHDLDLFYWNDNLRTWESSAPRPGKPDSANEHVLEVNVGSELGLPIFFGEDSVGVAWLKFGDRHRERPGRSEMTLAMRFARSAGPILGSLRTKQVA